MPARGVCSFNGTSCTNNSSSPTTVFGTFYNPNSNESMGDVRCIQEFHIMGTYEQHKEESVYWFNKASDLRGGAAILLGQHELGNARNCD